jgi:hypothetical protein
MDRLACPPNGGLAVRPHYDVSVHNGLPFIAFRGNLDRHFDTELADVQVFSLKLRNQVSEYEKVHNLPFPNVPGRMELSRLMLN